MRCLFLILILFLAMPVHASPSERSLLDITEHRESKHNKVTNLVSQAPIGKRGGTLKLTHSGQDPKTLNPWIANDASSSFYADILFEGLFRRDPDTDEPIANLAESYSIKSGGRIIEVRLREGLQWTDASPINADDVIYTWNVLIRDGVAQSSLRDILLVDGKFPKVTKLSNLSLRFETDQVFAPLLKNLSIPIAPKHAIERFLASRKAYSLDAKREAFNQYLSLESKTEDIVSSGAFRLSRIKSSERIEFIRNPKYFVVNKAGQRLPYLDRVIFTYVQDDSADVFKFLADESYELKVSPNNAALIKSLEKKYKYKLYDLGPSSGTNFIWFNMSPSIPLPKRLWFNSREFRRAISYTIDRDSMIANVFQGLAAPLFSAESLQSPFVHKGLGHSRNIPKALELLHSVGFRLERGQLYDAKHNPVIFELYTNAGNREREMMASIIAANLAEIGIKVHIKSLEFNNLVSRISAGKNYEAALLGLTGSHEPNGGANVWRSDARLHLFDQRSAGLNSPPRDWELEIDALFSQGIRTMDFRERQRIYNKFQEIVYRENPLIFLVSPRILVAASDKLGNLRATRLQGLMPNLHEIYLKNL